MTRRALILGAAGQVGFELQRTVPEGIVVTALDLPQVDIRDRSSVAKAIRDVRAEVVINCAAFTNVDGAESARDDAMVTNGVAPGIVAEESRHAGARMVHISTDYVFDGRAESPYDVDDQPAPLSAYGATKLEGERRVLAAGGAAVVVRTAWVHSAVGSNFVKTAVRHLTSGTEMRVVDDQIGTPTRAKNLAMALWSVAMKPDVKGILHFTDAGVASWYDVAAVVSNVLAAESRLGVGASVRPISSAEWPSVARRPLYCVLDKHDSWRTIGIVPPHWREGVAASTRELLNA